VRAEALIDYGPGMSSDRYAAWIEEQIDDHRPSEDHGALYRLATSCEALAAGQGLVFGMGYPAGLVRREELLAKALDVLREWVPRLGDGAMHQLGEIVRRANLPVELGARKTELVARRQPAIDARFSHLERAIADDPEDLTAFAVLADALQRDGDPRGELIALQVAAETDAIRAASHANRYLDAHRAELLGPLADVPPAAYMCRRGYIHRVRLRDELLDSEGLEHLLEHPAGRFLHEIAAGVIGSPGDGLDHVVHVLGSTGAPSLRVLQLGDFEYPDESEMSWFVVGDIDALWPGVPRLRHLITQGNVTAETIDHAMLERLEVRTGGLPRSAALAIAHARLPRLRYLEVWYGDSGYGAEATLDDVAPLLARRDLPELRHLGLRNCEFTDAIAAALPASALLPQLHTLDLSLGTLSDDGARAIAANADGFRHLRRIDVSRSWLSDAAVSALRQIGPEIIAADQQGDGGDDVRYVAIGE
jgi:uncharacterized protein (TIGR02996 family)